MKDRSRPSLGYVSGMILVAVMGSLLFQFFKHCAFADLQSIRANVARYAGESAGELVIGDMSFHMIPAGQVVGVLVGILSLDVPVLIALSQRRSIWSCFVPQMAGLIALAGSSYAGTIHAFASENYSQRGMWADFLPWALGFVVTFCAAVIFKIAVNTVSPLKNGAVVPIKDSTGGSAME